jgi:hypothetical protein
MPTLELRCFLHCQCSGTVTVTAAGTVKRKEEGEKEENNCTQTAPGPTGVTRCDRLKFEMEMHGWPGDSRCL